MTSPDSRVGLCAQCVWCHPVHSARGTVFHRCKRAESDTAFPRYPRLPVVRCSGFADTGDPTVTPSSAG